ncbi:hypothetical protein PV10_01703 [Exophiala mesophila]|uniref:DUF974 domain protein n=1 Tax=Exophiala mesophila TaxID=212818 RepID=A0A0D1ZVM3_EXOME|nr:uncharacterized protein PV10_01703 [Exophiala mesophila]KIV98009.1 hypothetical protein PV10_01703 [Exophiala mesophila]
MARPRADTGNYPKEPHSVSLKVLRLSRPSLVQQHALPRDSDIRIPHTASLAYPSETSDPEFALSNNLSLPPSFGSAHVGETFSCALCANNELIPGSTTTKTATGTKILAEMQTPTQSVPLELEAADGLDFSEETMPGESLQRIIRYDLKEEGNHVLAVNLSYTETTSGDGSATSGRARSFRKLYQFLAQPCISVRTKATELAPREVPDKSHGPYGRLPLLRYALEAQLENVSDSTIVLEDAKLQTKSPFKSTSLNWDAEQHEGADVDNPILNPRDVMQVAFVVQQVQGETNGLEELKASLRRDGRAVLGQLAIQWRTSMGEKGSLSTGNLLTRRRG